MTRIVTFCSISHDAVDIIHGFQLKFHTPKYVDASLSFCCNSKWFVFEGRAFFSKFPIAWVTAVDYICPRIMVGRLCRKSPAAWDSTSRKWLARVVTTLSHRGGRRRKTCNLNQQCRSNTTMHRVWSISWKMHTNKCCGSSQLAMVHQNLWAVLTFPQWRAAVGRWKAWQCADS